jgi:hypothetical protein
MRPPLPMPPINDLREYLRLDEDTGRLFWVKSKNTRYAVGSEAGASEGDPRGYRSLGWNAKKYLTHRVVFFLHTGTDPGEFCVDHINGDPSDNRPANLRLATPSQNLMNMRRPMRNNKTGVLGVHWSSQNKSWCAKLSVGGKQLCRFFQNFEDAVAAIALLRKEHYGEFAGGNP